MAKSRVPREPLPPFQGDVDHYLVTPVATLIREAGRRPARTTPRPGSWWGSVVIALAFWAGVWFLLMVGIHLWGWR